MKEAGVPNLPHWLFVGWPATFGSFVLFASLKCVCGWRQMCNRKSSTTSWFRALKASTTKRCAKRRRWRKSSCPTPKVTQWMKSEKQKPKRNSIARWRSSNSTKRYFILKVTRQVTKAWHNPRLSYSVLNTPVDISLLIFSLILPLSAEESVNNRQPAASRSSPQLLMAIFTCSSLPSVAMHDDHHDSSHGSHACPFVVVLRMMNDNWGKSHSFAFSLFFFPLASLSSHLFVDVVRLLIDRWQKWQRRKPSKLFWRESKISIRPSSSTPRPRRKSYCPMLKVGLLQKFIVCNFCYFPWKKRWPFCFVCCNIFRASCCRHDSTAIMMLMQHSLYLHLRDVHLLT